MGKSSVIKLASAGSAVVIGAMFTIFFGVPVYLAFLFIAIPVTFSTLIKVILPHKEFTWKDVLKMIVISSPFLVVSWYFALVLHFPARIYTVSDIMLISIPTFISFFTLIILVYGILSKKFLGVSVRVLWSGCTMWMGYFLILNLYNGPILDYIEESVAFSIFYLLLGAVAIYASPFLFAKSFREQVAGKNYAISELAEIILLIVFAFTTYTAFYYLIGWQYIISCC